MRGMRGMRGGGGKKGMNKKKSVFLLPERVGSQTANPADKLSLLSFHRLPFTRPITAWAGQRRGGYGMKPQLA